MTWQFEMHLNLGETISSRNNIKTATVKAVLSTGYLMWVEEYTPGFYHPIVGLVEFNKQLEEVS